MVNVCEFCWQSFTSSCSTAWCTKGWWVAGWLKALGWRSLRRLDWRLWGIKTNSAPTHTRIAPGQKKEHSKAHLCLCSFSRLATKLHHFPRFVALIEAVWDVAAKKHKFSSVTCVCQRNTKFTQIPLWEELATQFFVGGKWSGAGLKLCCLSVVRRANLGTGVGKKPRLPVKFNWVGPLFSFRLGRSGPQTVSFWQN